MTKIKYFIPVGIVLLGFLLFTVVAYGSRSFIASTQPTNQYIGFSFFSATTTNATSTTDGGNGFIIAGAKRVDFFFSHGGTATTSVGTSTFAVQVSPDGASWYDFGRLIQATSTLGTVQKNVSLSNGTTTAVFGLDLRTDAFYAVRCISSEGTPTTGTDGEATCTATAEF